MRRLSCPHCSTASLHRRQGCRLTLISRGVVINKNSRAWHGQTTADPVVFLLPQIHTTEVQRCYDKRAYLSAWFDSLNTSRGRLHQSNGHEDGPRCILTASSWRPWSL